jgi:hypothetical protein
VTTGITEGKKGLWPIAGQPTADPSHSAPKRTSFFPSLWFGEERFCCCRCSFVCSPIEKMRPEFGYFRSILIEKCISSKNRIVFVCLLLALRMYCWPRPPHKTIVRKRCTKRWLNQCKVSLPNKQADPAPTTRTSESESPSSTPAAGVQRPAQ